ncbi:MAG: YihY/virulence factor BrkB family protein [Treponema sp.]|jgi:membrane protein|nr:YihY/virulence factor BrkB family protein [Treponema sp.]
MLKRKFLSCVTQFLQRLYLAFDLFGRKGLANHAAAGAYGFFLSAVPALMILSFFIFRTIQASPETVAELISGTGFFEGSVDIEGIIRSFLQAQRPGLSGVISVLSIIWAAVIFASVLQRGLLTVFSNHETRVEKNPGPFGIFFVRVGIEAGFIIFTLAAMLNSEPAYKLLYILGFLPRRFPGLSRIVIVVISSSTMMLLIYRAYRLVPRTSQNKKDAFFGMLVCIFLYLPVSFFLQFIMHPGRYSFLYGALGNLIMFIVNMYFFFVFFFFGAEFANVSSCFAALFFGKFRKFDGLPAKKINSPVYRLFNSPENPLAKYFRAYKKGDIVIKKNEKNRDVYYLRKGSVGVFLDEKAETENREIAVITEGNFFGEMEYLSAKKRTAIIRANTDITVIAFPPGIFSQILRLDPAADMELVKTLSQRLKFANEQFLKAGAPQD